LTAAVTLRATLEDYLPYLRSYLRYKKDGVTEETQQYLAFSELTENYQKPITRRQKTDLKYKKSKKKYEPKRFKQKVISDEEPKPRHMVWCGKELRRRLWSIGEGEVEEFYDTRSSAFTTRKQMLEKNPRVCTAKEAVQWAFTEAVDIDLERSFFLTDDEEVKLNLDLVNLNVVLEYRNGNDRLVIGHDSEAQEDAWNNQKKRIPLDKQFLMPTDSPSPNLEIDLLNETDFNARAQDNRNRFALYKAITKGNTKMAEALVKKVKKINGIDWEGNSALHLAATHNMPTVVAALVDAGADLNQYDWKGNTALHLAIKENQNDCKDVALILMKGGADVTHKNNENSEAFDLLTDRQGFFMKTDFSFDIFVANIDVWFYLLQITDVEGLETRILDHVIKNGELATRKDRNGRVAVDVATPKNKEAINSVFLWHGKYRVTEARPEHTSATCFVYRGYDESDVDANGHPAPVAIKLMRMKAHFTRELGARDLGFSNDFIVGIKDRYPKTDTETEEWPEVTAFDTSGKVTLNKIEAEQFFCIVMPLANRNMFVALKQERFAGRNMEEVRHVFTQIVKCIDHMHGKGMLHADIKTLNIVRVDTTWKMIDFDAACMIGKDSVGFKSSSCYVPPETLYIDTKRNTIAVRSSAAKEHPYELVRAHPSFDVWGLGCILYQLTNADVRPLFQGGQDDNLTADRNEDDNLWRLIEWSEDTKRRKLARIVDDTAKNLLNQLLMKDASKRPTIERILAHPFVSKKSVSRMVGQAAEFDVFISYRVASDVQHAEIVYNTLTEKGLKVWWDKV
jgi:serine/threonine protein kinase